MTRTMRERVGGFRLMRISILTLVVAVVLFAGVSAWAWYRAGQVRVDLCGALAQMVDDDRDRFRTYFRDGAITQAQYRQERERIANQNVQLDAADCPPRPHR